MTDDIAAPDGLSDRSADLWRATVAEFELSAAEMELLRNALLSLDRADQAAAVIAEQGLTTTDRYGGSRPHPAVDIEHKSRALFGRLVAQLGIKLDETQPRRLGMAKPGPRPKTAHMRSVS